MIYAHKKKPHRQEVGEHEMVKRRLLEQNGWFVVEPVESVEPHEQASPALPDDFPGIEHLRAAGIVTVADLEAAGDLTEIEGVGKATAEKIHAALQR